MLCSSCGPDEWGAGAHVFEEREERAVVVDQIPDVAKAVARAVGRGRGRGRVCRRGEGRAWQRGEGFADHGVSSGLGLRAGRVRCMGNARRGGAGRAQAVQTY